jgi:hypothetical protein
MLLVAAAGAQAPDRSTAAVVEQAGRYVAAYVDAFSAVVSEERQTQTLRRADGRVKKTREITADFLLVKARGTWPEAYRDVIEVDGKPVRNREDRLKKLFLDQPKTAPQLADAIATESSRYNLGVNRRGNSPLLPIIFLTPRIAEGVHFEGTAAALTFQEVRTPTVLRHREGGSNNHNLPSHGSFEIEPGTGRVLAAVFTADNPDAPYSATFTVRYAIDPKLGISVPIEVTERYWQPAKPSEDVLDVRATYSSFRRFEVTTGEQIKK